MNQNNNFTTKAAKKPIDQVPSVPGDKSISHRAILLSALATGTSEITGLSEGDDVFRSLVAAEALGATVERDETKISVTGFTNRDNKREAFINCGNSGTAMRLLMGMCAGLSGRFEMDGDESLRTRPMDRVVTPLELMGATFAGNGERFTAPVTVFGGPLHGVDYEVPVASAQVKSAIMFAALFASSPTTIRETAKTRTHSEEMFLASGIDIDVDGLNIRVTPNMPNPHNWDVALDPSQIAFWVVAASFVKDSVLKFENVYVGKERIGFIGALINMGAHIEVIDTDPVLHSGTVSVRSSELVAADVAALDVPSLIDEIPILTVAAARALGTSRFGGLSELRVKESDRLNACCELANQLGATATIEGDDLLIQGAKTFNGGFNFDSRSDHRLAMACAVAGLIAKEPIEISGFSSVETSYPNFAQEYSRWT